MKKNEILLSGGSIPWLGLKQSLQYIKDIEYDGLEILPTRIIVSEIKKLIRKSKKENWTNYIQNANLIKSIHQSWRLDIGRDKLYGIKFPISILFLLLRIILFPKIKESNKIIEFLSSNLNLPIIVHDLTNKWTFDSQNKEFLSGILYEIMGTSTTSQELKVWMKKENHNIVIDSRDDQSLVWANKYDFNTWQEFWKWIELKKIKSLQLTLIGIQGLRKIIRCEKSLAEEQLLWLYNNKWKGSVTVEINPLALLFLSKGNMKKGYRTIGQFVRQTLIDGRKWS